MTERARIIRGWVVLAAAPLLATACDIGDGGSATDPSVSADAVEFTFANHSSAAEYCGVLSMYAPDLPPDLDTTNPAAARVAVSAISDLEILAPEENKPDWAAIRGILQLVADADGNPDDHETAQLATADEQFDEAKDRLSATMAQICPDDITWDSTGG